MGQTGNCLLKKLTAEWKENTTSPWTGLLIGEGESLLIYH